MKHNSKREKQIFLVVILNNNEWHYLAVKDLSTLLRGITSNHYGDFCCLNHLYWFGTKNKFEPLKKDVKKKIFVVLIWLVRKILLLKFTQYLKSIKTPVLIYSVIECLIKK